MQRAGVHGKRRWWLALPLGAVALAGSAALIWQIHSAPPAESEDVPADVIATRFPAGWSERAPLSPAAFALAYAKKNEELARTSPLDLLSQPLIFDEARQDLARLEPYPAAGQQESVNRPSVQPRLRRPNALFTDGQIANIKARLKLTSDQESLWPEVAAALAEISWRGQNSRKATLDPRSLDKVVTALTPFVKKLRPEQKDELRSLAHVMGLEHLASQL